MARGYLTMASLERSRYNPNGPFAELITVWRRTFRIVGTFNRRARCSDDCGACRGETEREYSSPFSSGFFTSKYLRVHVALRNTHSRSRLVRIAVSFCDCKL